MTSSIKFFLSHGYLNRYILCVMRFIFVYRNYPNVYLDYLTYFRHLVDLKCLLGDKRKKYHNNINILIEDSGFSVLSTKPKKCYKNNYKILNIII